MRTMTAKTKRRISILLLEAAIIAEFFGLFIAILTEEQPYLFFTNMGNACYLLLAIAVLCLQVVALKTGKEFPRLVFVLHYIGTATETLIFLIVALYLVWFSGPMMLYSGSFPFLHVLCPLLAVANHCFFIGKPEFKKTDALFGAIPPLLYASVIIPLCATGLIEAPYPFLEFGANPWWLTLLYGIGSILVMALICFLLLHFAKKTQNLTEKRK